MFAKLFDTDRGQILVKLDTDDEDGSEIRFYAQPPGLGVCSFAIVFRNGNDATAAENAFLAITEEDAIEAVAYLYRTAAPLTPVGDGASA